MKRWKREERLEYNELVVHVLTHSYSSIWEIKSDHNADFTRAIKYGYNAYGFSKLSLDYFDHDVFVPVMEP